MLEAFTEDVKYGPCFPCSCCQTLNVRSSMVREREVEGLAPAEAKERYLDQGLIASAGKDVFKISALLMVSTLINKTYFSGCLFKMLDDTWICKFCQKSIGEERMPLFCAKNCLRATWRDLPPDLLDMNCEELDAFSLSKIFVVVHGLTAGNPNIGSNMPKTLFLPESRPANVEGGSFDLPLRMHKRPPGRTTSMRPEKILAVDQHLLGREKEEYSRHRAGLREWCRRELAKTERGNHQADVEESENVNRQLFVTVLPDLDDVEEASQIINIGCLDARTRHLYDPSGESGPEVSREESITTRQWMVQRLKSVFRSGPANDAAFILGMLIRLETSQLIQLKRLPEDRLKSSLMSMPGRKEFFAKRASDLRAIATNLGPATLSFTTSTSFGSDHHLACFVSQRRHVEEHKDCQVWYNKDEEELLTARSPHAARTEEGKGYFVHERTDVSEDTCKFHNYCRRTPLQNFSRWYDIKHY